MSGRVKMLRYLQKVRLPDDLFSSVKTIRNTSDIDMWFRKGFHLILAMSYQLPSRVPTKGISLLKTEHACAIHLVIELIPGVKGLSRFPARGETIFELH